MFAGDFEDMAKANANFRKVLATGEYAQVVAMSLRVGEDIGEETHADTDQIFLIAEGEADAVVGGETQRLDDESIIFVPAGTLHNIRNTGDEDLKLLTIYSPPAHPDGTINETKAEAEAESAD